MQRIESRQRPKRKRSDTARVCLNLLGIIDLNCSFEARSDRRTGAHIPPVFSALGSTTSLCCLRSYAGLEHTSQQQQYFLQRESHSFASSSASQPLDMRTALSHLLNSFLLLSSSIFGSNVVWPAVFTSFNSSKLFQTPVAKPAAIAAPRAVVSLIFGRTTGILTKSACVCIQREELDIPPSTLSCLSLCPLSFSMASRIAFVWKQTASRVARAMWPRSVWCVMPTKERQHFSTRYWSDHTYT